MFEYLNLEDILNTKYHKLSIKSPPFNKHPPPAFQEKKVNKVPSLLYQSPLYLS